MPEKYCIFCGETVLGRIDKKFCDDHCRSSFNNSQHVGLNQKLKEINLSLKKNRMILFKILEAQKLGSTQILNRKLQEMGFQFKYHTHYEITTTGETCVCCYEFGIIPNGDEIKVIKFGEQN
jgi:predicted nucleic acid-binding Zn ribbon protein